LVVVSLIKAVVRLVVISDPQDAPLYVRARSLPSLSFCIRLMTSELGEAVISSPTMTSPEVVVWAVQLVRPPACVQVATLGCWVVLVLAVALKKACGVPECAFSQTVLTFWPASWAMAKVARVVGQLAVVPSPFQIYGWAVAAPPVDVEPKAAIILMRLLCG